MTRAESHNLPWNLTFILTLTSKSVTSILRISNFSSRSSPGAQRVNERKEQYKKVRTHVKQEDGRMHAYGWSLPANKPNTASSAASTPTSEDSRNANVPVPVPVYCRPLMEKEPGMKVWFDKFTKISEIHKIRKINETHKISEIHKINEINQISEIRKIRKIHKNS